MLLQDLKEFSQETSIHGLGQIADDAATKSKRFIWIIIFLGSLTYAGFMLHDAYIGGYSFSNDLAQFIWGFSGISCLVQKIRRPGPFNFLQVDSTFYFLTKLNGDVFSPFRLKYLLQCDSLSCEQFFYNKANIGP